MLPLLLLKTAQKHPVLVELKNGETYNGHMVQCDSWMNVHLREVICTSKDGDRFWRIPETYIRGNTIKYLRVPDEVIDKVKEEDYKRDEEGAEVLLGEAMVSLEAVEVHLAEVGEEEGDVSTGSHVLSFWILESFPTAIFAVLFWVQIWATT
ncbi:probable U6 snRNA-associated Sm-like protein LSm4 at N-terminal half [Coccomyxa sp. Obi]|nr:probable U6 snRNA-associated Sm-like protein LSm4 at N-terminal half [Coccomyxa sp. Obi]